MGNKLTWTNNELEDLVRQLGIALEASGIGIWQHNIAKNQTRWDDQLQRIYGVAKGEHDVIWLESVHPDDCPGASTIFKAAIANKSDYASEFRIIRPDGEIRHIRSRAQYFVDGQGEACFIGAEWDVTEDALRNQQLAKQREAAEQSRAEARYAADHDSLTSLLNRRAFDDAFARLLQAPEPVASLCHIDIDRFKEINDRFGHACGDAVIIAISAILTAAFNDGSVVARLGGEEFGVIVTGSPLSARLEQVEQVKMQIAQQPIIADGCSIAITISAGIADLETGRSKEAVYASADKALYLAKALGRNRVIHESEGLHHAWHSRLVESGLGVQGDAADHDEPQRAYGI